MSTQTAVSDIFPNEIVELLGSLAREHGFKEYNIIKTGESVKGDGYMGVITMLEITSNCNVEKNKLSLVVKSARKGDGFREGMQVDEIFKREIYMYLHVVPSLHQFAKKRGAQQFASFAKCYKATAVHKSEALILENLKTKGLRLWERNLPMDDAHVALVMQEFGRLHALSFAMREQDLPLFQTLTDKLDDIFDEFIKRNNFVDILTSGCIKVCETFTSSEDSKARSTFKKFIDSAPRFILDIPKLVDNNSVILHGDCWSNNMMFGYDDISNPNNPTKMCLLDLQISKLGPPVLDIAYFFYSSGSKDVIDNYQYYLDIYYNSLTDYLEQLGSKSEKVFPYSVFMKQWKELARYGLLMSILVIKVTMSKQEEIEDLADLAESGKTLASALDYNISNPEEYNERVKHIVLHFVNNNFI